jgi:hypothetical protein
MAEFRSKYIELKIAYRPAILSGEKLVDSAKFICFEKGVYHTDDKDEIKFLREERWKQLVFEVTFVQQQIRKEAVKQTQVDADGKIKKSQTQVDAEEEKPDEELDPKEE